ncbi:MAG: phage tail protein, partial [Pseudomonadota bacterium]
DKDLSSRAGHEIRWQGLKGYLDSEVDWSTETILLVKMRATDNLSQRSSRLVNVIATRMLFAWDPVTGWSAEEVPTRSIAWAAAHVCRSENGWALPDSRIDLQGLWQLEQTWSARGDEFNGGFDSGVTVWDALQTIMRCGRAVAIQQRGIIRFVRDELKTVPTAFFGPRNIVKGSFSIKYILPGEDNADAVEIGYFSERNWKPARVTAKLADSSASKPAKVKMVGITKKDQGYREGYYIAADNRYRRRMVTFRTRLEALSCSYGDLAVISHPMPQWGQGGEVVEWDPDTGLMTVSEPLTWAEGVDHYIGLRKRDNALSGPWKVEPVPDQPRQLLVVEDLDITPYTGAEEERTHFAFGPDLDWCRFAKIRGVRPRGNQVEVTAAIEDERVHEDPPPLA